MPSASFTVLWPLPDDDMTGLTTSGKPMRCAAAANSSRLVAYSKVEVARPNSLAARSRIASRFIVNCAARADGTT